jgi:hypothetical protein
VCFIVYGLVPRVAGKSTPPSVSEPLNKKLRHRNLRPGRKGDAMSSRSGLSQPVRTTHRHRLLWQHLVGAGFMLFLAYSPGRFGLSHDGIYVSTERWRRGGYRLISLPYAPPQTKYPPLYPFLLSVIWRVNNISQERQCDGVHRVFNLDFLE